MEDERSELARESNDWYPCKLPKNGQLMKVQFVVLQPEEPIPEKKKEEPPKPVKKSETASHFINLFRYSNWSEFINFFFSRFLV